MIDVSSIHYRLLTGDDGSEYQRLRLQALASDPNAFVSSLESEQDRHESLFAWELDSTYHPPVFGYYGAWITDAHGDDRLLGFVLINQSGLVKQNHVAFLYNLYLDPTFRGQGIAQSLVQYALEQLRQHAHPPIEQIYLSCVATNKPAYHFYKNMGWRRCGIKPRSIKWQGRYADELEMVKLLQ